MLQQKNVPSPRKFGSSQKTSPWEKHGKTAGVCPFSEKNGVRLWPPGTWSIHLEMVGCQLDDEPNHYIRNCCFTKHPFKTGCLGYQAFVIFSLGGESFSLLTERVVNCDVGHEHSLMSGPEQLWNCYSFCYKGVVLPVVKYFRVFLALSPKFCGYFWKTDCKQVVLGAWSKLRSNHITHLEPEGHPFRNGSFNWMMNQIIT